MIYMPISEHMHIIKKSTYTLTHFPFAHRLYDHMDSSWIDNRITERDKLIRVKKCNFPNYIIL